MELNGRDIVDSREAFAAVEEGAADLAMIAIENTLGGRVADIHHLLPEFNARDNVAMPLMVNGVKRRIARQKADVLLAEMGLESRADHQPGQLSGGEQQRVAIARALVNDPKLVIADEPTGNLDPTTTDRVFASLIRIARSEGAAVLVATHNMALTRHMDRVLTLQDGKLTTFTG